MIAALTGQVERLTPSIIILWVNGVGYQVFIPANLNPSPSQTITLYTHTHVKEDSISLYGFDTKEKLFLFTSFIQISGIGPKLALAILENNKPAVIKQAIQRNDVSFFTRVPGIGKKGAQKIILELSSTLSPDIPLSLKTTHQPLVQALKTLGYKTPEIYPVISQLDLDNLSLEEQLKQALKVLAQK
ncbi:MAG: Holliday junction branch migration protein RuvA [bacterium]|nr:Holliday junction branch migration protein RuvA [bacterium]